MLSTYLSVPALINFLLYTVQHKVYQTIAIFIYVFSFLVFKEFCEVFLINFKKSYLCMHVANKKFYLLAILFMFHLKSDVV